MVVDWQKISDVERCANPCTAFRPNPMPTPRRKRIRQPDRVGALELLAECGAEGWSEAIMRAHGFAVEQMVDGGKSRE